MVSLTVLIAGGGIGGLTTALCLAQAGARVRLFEQTPEFAEAGAGIQLSPNCTRVLHHLGLAPALRQYAFVPEGTRFRQWNNAKLIGESTLGDQAVARYGYPYYHMHRGDLLGVLVKAAKQNPSITLETDARVQDFVQNGSVVTLQTDASSYSGDLLVGADGIHSVVRAGLWGDQTPHFTGNVAWRALVPLDRLPSDLIQPVSTVWWGPGKHFVHYYVRQGELVNCVCVVEKKGWEVESWTEPGDLSELKAEFSGWHQSIQQLIDNIDEQSLYKWALFDRAQCLIGVKQG